MATMVTVGVIGSGSMGAGIAQVAATAGHQVRLFDNNGEALQKAMEKLKKTFDRLVEKGKYSQDESSAILSRISTVNGLTELKPCGIVIEAIIENLGIKQKVFRELEGIVDATCMLATNTSSLSIASIASACKQAERVVGIHFFNPAPLMPLVEIIPSLTTSSKVLEEARSLIDSWGKVTVLAKDTPGFIVNRLARPFYGEAIRIYEEGVADIPTIDWAMKHIGGFRMGPFELMDYIGNDVNYTVTETVFKEFFYDPRYKPSFTQKRLAEAGLLGKKTGRGYYDYREGAENALPKEDEELGKGIFQRIIVMLVNEAADALLLNIASKEDLDLAMTKGVNYPKGLLRWADELGIASCLETLEGLQAEYGEDRYRASPMLRRLAAKNGKFFN
jgi:3-hydroxybutyryl-CoA dehydrogenase